MKLTVLTEFRDIADFAIVHKAGSVIEVSDPDRAACLVAGGICEPLAEPAAKQAVEANELAAAVQAAPVNHDPEPVNETDPLPKPKPRRRK